MATDDWRLDPRGRTAFRVILGVTLALDLFDRLMLAPWLYGPEGLLSPASWSALQGARPYHWSLHLGLPSDAAVAWVIATQVVVAAVLALGIRPTALALLSWGMLLSLNGRNPLVVYGGDKLATKLLLIAAIMPWPERGRPAARASATVATVVLLAQVIVLYVGAGVAKLGSPVWQSGEALEHALGLLVLTKPAVAWVAGQATLLRWATLATPWVQVVAPWLLLLPRTRLWGLGALLAMDAGIFMAFDVGWFMPYTLAALVALVPGSAWDRLGVTPRETWKEATWSWSDRARGVLGGVFLVVCVGTGLESMAAGPRLPWPQAAWTAVRGANLYQNWGVFTRLEEVPRWYVAKARLADGTWVDALDDGREVLWDRPSGRPARFEESFRWRLAVVKGTAARRKGTVGADLARAIGGAWTADHPDRAAVEVTLYELVGAPEGAGHSHWDTVGTWAADAAAPGAP